MAAPAAATFVERFVDVDGFHIRFMEAGTGEPLVYLHGAGGLRISPAHALLAHSHRVLAFEQPGFGTSLENTRSHTARELAATIGAAVSAVGIERFELMGTSFGGITALWLACQSPDRVRALVLESPAALRPDGHSRAVVPPEQRAGLLYAHPERVEPAPSLPSSVVEQQERLVRRLEGPNRDPDLERRMRELAVSTLVLFGTRDRLISPDMGRLYRELIPRCHFILVYNAGHAISFDRPEAFASVVGDFLDRGEAFVVSSASEQLFP